MRCASSQKNRQVTVRSSGLLNFSSRSSNSRSSRKRKERQRRRRRLIKDMFGGNFTDTSQEGVFFTPVTISLTLFTNLINDPFFR